MTPAYRQPLHSLLAGAAAVACLAGAGAAQAASDPATAPRPYAQAFGAQPTPTVQIYPTAGDPGSPTLSGPLAPLSDSDARTYAAAFDAVKKGQFDLAEAIASAVQDTCLRGRLQYAKLMHAAYKSTYGELKTWLDHYRDQPGADRIFTLAQKRRASEAASAPAPQDIDTLLAAQTDDGPARPVKDADPQLQQSREAFYGGDVSTAYALATASGERWIAGLAAFRLGKFEESFRWLSDLAQDDAQNEWSRSAAAWWAARSAATAGLTEQAAPFLRLAAATPHTFYGLIAARQLGADRIDALAPPGAPVLPGGPQPYLGGVLTPTVSDLISNDARARRAAALAQAGLRIDAGVEMRSALLGAGDPEKRSAFRALAAALDMPLTAPDEARRSLAGGFDITQLEAPTLSPRGGFTLEKALVYAIVRQESRFNADAVSAAGAYGLMQLMPATAALVKGDVRRPISPALLKKPAENLRIGQDYLARILDQVNGDLIRAVASYNSGPGTILKTVARLGPDADSLLVIESMPGAETREYVERVMANYWIYRKLWALPSPSLDAVAAGQSRILATLDANNGQGAKLARAN